MQAMSMAQNAANQPFQTPAAPVADFTPDQMSAFQGIRDTQGMAQPYFNQAANYTNQSAQPISDSEVSNYFNPMAGAVGAQLQNIFGQQMRTTTGQLTQAAGGIGADRIAVGQSNLANQQALAAGKVFSDLYQPALGAAQQDRQRQANAGYAFAGYGTGAQNAALQGQNAMLGTGGLQQQLEQAKLMSPYNQQLQKIAYPFQTAQYLAGITGQVAPAAGGTTTGNNQSQSHSIKKDTPAPPSILSQIAGLGMAAVGAYMGNPGMMMGGLGGMGGGKGSGSGYGGSPFGGGLESGGNNGMPIYLSGNNNTGFASASNPYWGAHGGRVESPGSYADGGEVDDPTAQEVINTRFPFQVPFNTNPNPRAAAPLLRGMASQPGTPAPGVPLPMPRPNMPVLPGSVPTPNNPWAKIAGAQPRPGLPPGALPLDEPGPDEPPADDSALPPGAQPAAGAMPGMDGAAGLMPPMPESETPYPDALKRDEGQQFARSPWMALTAAGLATAAGTSPYAGVNIGKGGLEGIKTLESQRKALREEQDVNMKAKQLWQDAQKHLDKYRSLTKAEEIAEKRAEQQARYQNALIAKQLKQLELEGYKPFKIGEDPDTGVDIYGVRDPSGKRPFIPLDPKTGRPKEDAPIPGVTKPKDPHADAPPPLGVPELKPDLEPTKNTDPQRVKGPFATSEANTIKGIDTNMNKLTRDIDTQRDNLTRLKMGYTTLMRDSDKDGFFQKILTLPGAPVDPDKRIAVMRSLNAGVTAANTKLPPDKQKPLPFSPDKIAAMEEISKITKTMGFTFASTISPREAVQGQMMAISAQPNLIQSPQGMLRLIGLYDGLNRHAEAKHAFWGRWRKTNPRTSVGWEEDFREKNPTEKFTVRGIIENLPNRQDVAALPKAIEILRANKDNPKVVERFNKAYGNTASYFLNGQLDPFSGLQ